MANMPPVPYQSAVTNENGIISNAWAQWFRQLFVRVGGFDALSNSELASDATVTGLSSSVLTIQTTVSGNVLSLQSVQDEINGLSQGPNL